MNTHDPVSEVVFSIQFPQIAGMTVLDVCAFYDRLKDQFPTVQHAPRLPPIPATPTPAQPFVTYGAVLEFPRTWLISSDTHRLVQLQDDRFSFNWRRMGAGEYPGYEKLKHEFASVFEQVADWYAAKFGGQRLVPTLCELHYQNQIPLRDAKGEKRLFEVFAFQKEIKRKIGGFNASWIEPPSEEGQGYTAISAAAGATPDGVPVAILNLSAITPVPAETVPSSWFEVGHTRALDIFRSLIVQGS